eukprot:7367_1
MIRVGMDIGGTKFLLIAVDKDGNITHKYQVPTGRKFTIKQAEQAISDFLLKHFGDRLARVSIGLSQPGLLETTPEGHRSILCAINVPLLSQWVPATGEIIQQCACVRVITDAEAAVFEAKRECKRQGINDVKHMAVLVVGTGLGAAFVVDGKLMSGANGFAGELGVAPATTTLTFGETCGGNALLNGSGMSASELNEAIDRKDAKCLELIRKYGGGLGRAMAVVINIFNPQVLFLGGGTLRWPGYLQAATEEAQARALSEIYQECLILTSERPELLPALGAAH